MDRALAYGARDRGSTPWRGAAADAEVVEASGCGPGYNGFESRPSPWMPSGRRDTLFSWTTATPRGSSSVGTESHGSPARRSAGSRRRRPCIDPEMVRRACTRSTAFRAKLSWSQGSIWRSRSISATYMAARWPAPSTSRLRRSQRNAASQRGRLPRRFLALGSAAVYDLPTAALERPAGTR